LLPATYYRYLHFPTFFLVSNKSVPLFSREKLRLNMSSVTSQKDVADCISCWLAYLQVSHKILYLPIGSGTLKWPAISIEKVVG